MIVAALSFLFALVVGLTCTVTFLVRGNRRMRAGACVECGGQRYHAAWCRRRW